MSNLSVFSHDGVEIIINTATGESFCSVSGYARMSGKDKGTISRRLKGVAKESVETDEILTPGGIQGVALITEKIFKKWIIRDNPELAEQMMDAGVRLFLHKMAGYQITSTAIEPQPAPQPVPQLPPADRRVVELTQALQTLGIDLNNPRYSQSLQDYALDILGAKTLPVSTERWVGVVELAEEMGYSHAKELNHRSALGRYVSAKGGGDLHRIQEKRLCNGTQRPCWLYLDCDRLRHLIDSYFAA